ncbi:MAG: protocatechuate 3,4-dioxygenase subunit alpha [Acidimicrobiales bacterium]
MGWMGDAGTHVVAPTAEGAVVLTGRVLDGGGEPIPDAMVEIWQADAEGRLGAREGFAGFGRCLTDEGGGYHFTTVRPGPVGAAAPYIAMNVFARGTLQRLVTRAYLPDEPANGTDPVLASLEPDRRATLVARAHGGELRHDIRLQGEGETVFLVW